MRFLRAAFTELIWLLSEIECVCSQPGHRLPLRHLFLRLKRAKYGPNLWIGRGFWLLRGRNLQVGQRCAFGEFARIADHAPITIGDDFLAPTGLTINSGGHDPLTLQPQLGPITIGKRVWVGVNVTILAGVNIGDDVVIGAGALVCNDIPSGSVAVGIPAKVIKPLARDPEKKLWTWVAPQADRR